LKNLKKKTLKTYKRELNRNVINVYYIYGQNVTAV